MEKVCRTLTKEDEQVLFKMSEQMDEIQDNADKAEAVSDIFTDAMEGLRCCGSICASAKTIISIAKVIHDYDSKVAEGMEDLHERFRNFYQGKFKGQTETENIQ